MTRPLDAASRGLARGARALGLAAVRARAPTLLAWACAAVVLGLAIPPGSGGSDALGLPVPGDAAAVAAQQRSYAAFGFPLITRTLVVQRDDRGLDAAALTSSAALAARLDLGRDRGLRGLRAAIPVADVPSLLADGPPAAGRGPRTVVTFLVADPSASGRARTALAERYAARLGPGAHVAGVTGTVPARVEMVDRIRDALPWVTVATVLLVAAVLTVAFRAPGPAVVALAAVAVAYVVSASAAGWIGRATGLAAPDEARPVMVVLLLGIVTDYTVFILTAVRRRLRAGDDGPAAARAAVGTAGPVVATAGLAVAAGTAALLAAQLGFFRALGPGLAMTALVGTAVSLTFVPAAAAAAGPLLLRPGGLRPPRGRRARAGRRLRRALLASAARRPARRGAAVVAVAVMALLAAAAWSMRLDPTIIGALPPRAPAARAAAAAAEGFPPGIVAPSVVLVSGDGVTPGAARALQRELAGSEGLAGVLGPATPPAVGLGTRPRGVFVERGAHVARYLLLLDTDPLGPAAIADVRRLDDRLPGMLARAGMPRATAAIAGDTALASEALRATRSDLLRVGAVALVAILVILSLALGSVAAPLVLLGGAALALVATIGAATLVIQPAAGAAGVQYFVPFAAAVLLLSLGSDYGVYMLRSIADRARTRSPVAAVTGALRASAGAIALAAGILAGSFALLAIVPLDPFREFAVAMVIGIALAAVVVPMVVVPPVLVALGRRALRRGPAPQPGAPSPGGFAGRALREVARRRPES